MTDIQSDRHLQAAEASLEHRFAAKPTRYIWSTPEAMGWPAILDSAQLRRQRRQDRKVGLPVLGLVASVWFCVGLCLPGGLPPQVNPHPAKPNPAHRAELANRVARPMPTLLARRD
jgi:hypothetical protein